MTVRTIATFVLGLVLVGFGGQAFARQPGARHIAHQYLKDMGATNYTLTGITDSYVTDTFPGMSFFAVVFEQYPLQVQPPEGLNPSDVVIVFGETVFPLTDPDGLKNFFLNHVEPVADDNAALDAGRAWMRLTEVFSQDGYFTFSEPAVQLSGQGFSGGIVGGEVDVLDGGEGYILGYLNFDATGALTDVSEERNVQPGVRPLGP
jgi:hypothetical protein